MKLALIGLGRMGGNMARRLLSRGHQVVGYNRTYPATRQLAEENNLIPTQSLEGAVKVLRELTDGPCIVWMMLPAGNPTEETTLALGELLKSGDIIIDGGNSNYKDSIRRGMLLSQKAIHFLDAGVSGGIWGLTEGYSMMIGGDQEVVELLRPIFEALAPGIDKGWGHVGPQGAGHYVKMIHNGIEYGLMEAYAEGFELLHAHQDYKLDLYQVGEIWRYGSVVRSWLLDLITPVLEGNRDLSGIQGWVADSGEGRWTVMEAIDQATPAPVIALSLFRRFASRQEESFAARIVAAMRNQFGGHAIK